MLPEDETADESKDDEMAWSKVLHAALTSLASEHGGPSVAVLEVCAVILSALPRTDADAPCHGGVLSSAISSQVT